jgi:hypothetical protein
MGIPGTGPFFRYLLVSTGNSSHKAGGDGEYKPPEVERIKTIAAARQG